MAGYSREELLEKRIFDLVAFDLTQAKQVVSEIMLSSKGYRRVVVRTKDGEKMKLLAKYKAVRHGKTYYQFGKIVKVDDKK